MKKPSEIKVLQGLYKGQHLLYKWIFAFLVAVVAQLVEPRIVIPVVAGSSPVDRPIFHTHFSRTCSSPFGNPALFELTASEDSKCL